MSKKKNIDDFDFAPTLHMITSSKEPFWETAYRWLSKIALGDFILFALVACYWPSILSMNAWLSWVFAAPIALFIIAFISGYALSIVLLVKNFVTWLFKRGK